MILLIKGVIIDLEETLLRVEKIPAEQEQAAVRAAALCGWSDIKSFTAVIRDRYQKYAFWAHSENKEAGDFDLWHTWLLPELEENHLRLLCHELTAELCRMEGNRRVVPGALRTVRTLYDRGFRLGIVSNLVGEREIPIWLEESGVKQYFDAVALSPVRRVRRPDPAIYRPVWEELGLEPRECASISGASGRDIQGEKTAGIGVSILLAQPDFQGTAGADYVVRQLTEILDLPPLQPGNTWKE